VKIFGICFRAHAQQNSGNFQISVFNRDVKRRVSVIASVFGVDALALEIKAITSETLSS
jgi:hypothetical protein